MLDICLLGTGGMMPMPDRFLTALLCRYNGGMLLIDCGEGTQVTLKMLGWGFKNIHTLLFTHFHADHISGLPGMLLAIGNSGRTDPILIAGPHGLQEVVTGLRTIAKDLPYAIEFLELTRASSSFNRHGFFIQFLSVDHVMPCYAYHVSIERQGRFLAERAITLNLPKPYWGQLQNGNYVTYSGKVYTPDMVMGPARQGLHVCYCTDTRPTAALIPFIKEADLFVCEGMYGEEEKSIMAMEKKHMLFSEAATLAKKADVKELWLTHFSPSLRDPKAYLENATRIFPPTIIGTDRLYKTLHFDE